MRTIALGIFVLFAQILLAQQVVVTVDQSWQGGYNGKVTITPNQDISDWSIEIQLDGDNVHAWNADFTYANGVLTLNAQPQNSMIQAGQTYDQIGFSVSGTNPTFPTLLDFTFSGAAAQGGESLTDSHWVLDTLSGDLTLDEDVTGNVGIGSADPSVKLEVEDNGQVGLQYNGSNSIWAGCYMNATNGGSPFYGYKNAGEFAGWTYMNDQNTYIVHAGGNNSGDDMYVKANGNVGIGNANPDFKLELDGTAQVGIQYNGSNDLWAGMYMNATGEGKPFYGYKNSDEFAGWTYVDDANTFIVHAGGNGSGDDLYVRENGNVGIGNANPGFKLELNGGSQVGIQFNGSNELWAGMYMNATGGGKPFYGYKRNGEFSGWTFVDDRGYYAIHTGGNNGIDAVFVGTNGNVGIGNASPGYKLEMNGTAQVGMQYNGSNDLWAGCYMNATGGGKPFYGYKLNGEFRGWTFVNDLGNYVIHAGGNDAAGSDALFVNPNGNVGIGTQTLNNSFRFSVNGSIRAKEIVVETNWADFVFEEGYALKTIEEVEAFVKKEGHLPGVPSAEEIQANGVALGDSQTMLLQKVEELTLYVIELNKEIETLKAEKR